MQINVKDQSCWILPFAAAQLEPVYCSTSQNLLQVTPTRLGEFVTMSIYTKYISYTTWDV